jgi:hypothetical protein
MSDINAIQSLVVGGGRGATAGQAEFQSLINIAQDPNSTQLEIDSARRALGDLAKVSTSAQERIAESPGLTSKVAESVAEIEGSKETSKLTSQLKIKPQIAKAEEEVKIKSDLRKQTQKQNSQRMSDLTRTEKSRASTTKKAARFLKAFKSSAKSGASRSALSFLPGVFTDQAQFDEQFGAFAEVAARAKLKEAGEIRPTDADVEGMKRAIFGVGRDEETNINLLQEFIEDQGNSDIELDELRDAKKMGKLDIFNGVTERTEADILAEYGVQ